MRIVWVVLFLSTSACRLEQESRTSECGGFGTIEAPSLARVAHIDQEEVELAYCAAEILGWSYEKEKGMLTLINQRVVFNCCAEPTIEIDDEGGGAYVLYEDENRNDAICACTCSFDLEVTATGVFEETIDLTLERDVTGNSGGPRTIWSGRLDLSEVFGGIVVDPEPTWDCLQ